MKTIEILVAILCIALIAYVFIKNVKANAKSGIRNTSNDYLEYGQMIFDKMDETAIPNSEKPKSKLRGVRKRYQKV